MTTCTNCNTQFEAPDETFGKIIPCKNCSHEFRALFSVEKKRDDLLGVAICELCGARHKIREKHKDLVGKQVRCVNCREYFTVSLSVASENDVEAAEQEKGKTKQVDEAVEEATQKIFGAFQEIQKRLSILVDKGKRNESEVQRWCIDFLKGGLGYKDEEIETELKILGQRVDIAIKRDDKVLMVIECKSANVSLTPTVRNQAVRYAVNFGAEWAVTTNGQIWKLYQITSRPGEEPECTEVFDIFLLDENGVSEYELDCLFLLTSESLESGNTARNAHFCACMSEKYLLPALTSPKVVEVICKELEETYFKETGFRTEADRNSIVEYIKDTFGELEL